MLFNATFNNISVILLLHIIETSDYNMQALMHDTVDYFLKIKQIQPMHLDFSHSTHIPNLLTLYLMFSQFSEKIKMQYIDKARVTDNSLHII